MERQKISNYEKLCEDWRQKFLTMDQSRLLRKLPELKEEGDYLTLRHFGRKFGIHRQYGNIILLDSEKDKIDTGTRMNIYNLLWYSKETAFFRNRWVPFRSVKGAGPFDPAFQKTVLKPFARTFSGKTEKLKLAAERLGGVPVKQGDAGYILQAFACIPMQFLFWDGDEEFEAQANILFDQSVTDYIHVESTVSLAVEGVNRLAAMAGIQAEGQTFEM